MKFVYYWLIATIPRRDASQIIKKKSTPMDEAKF